MRKTCDACSPSVVNGAFCHERGCPNADKTWIVENGEGRWVRFLTCPDCGGDVPEGETCPDCEEEE